MRERRNKSLSDSVDLTGYEIYDIYGVGRKELTGKYTKEALVELFCNEWVQPIECHKCGRVDYCKYPVQNPYNPDKKLDIPCGVVVNSIKTHVNSTFEILQKMDKKLIQRYLDGCFYFSQYIAESEMAIGMYIDDMVSYFGSYAPAMVGHVAKIRDTLNMMSREFNKIPEFRIDRGVLFVEGESEEAFLNKLKDSHSSWFLNLIVENYKGEGNSKPRRILMLLEDYKAKGYTVYLQGDADGKEPQKFNSVKDLVEKDNLFIFKHDFETAVPPNLLLFCLQKLDCLLDITEEEFVARVTSEDKSVVKIIKEVYDIDLDPIKVELATMVARVLNSSPGWWQNEDFMNTALGQFLRFVQKIK